MGLLNFQRGDIAETYGMLKDYQLHKSNLETAKITQRGLLQQEAIRDIALNRDKIAFENEQAQMKTLKRPQSLDDLTNFNKISQYAPQTAKRAKEWLIGQGIAEPITDTEGQVIDYQSNSWKYQMLLSTQPDTFLAFLNEGRVEVKNLKNQLETQMNEVIKTKGTGDKSLLMMRAETERLNGILQGLDEQREIIRQKLGIKGDISMTEVEWAKGSGLTYQEYAQGQAGGQKIPIQSDKLQGAMAELGIDVRDPANYTPENISKASARLRVIEAQERRERGEELNAIQRSNIAHQLRTELRQDKYVQDFKDVDNKFKVMESAYAKSKTGKEKTFVAIDQALITLYNKMTDPSSVVRESEYARTPENMSIANRVLGKIDKWRQGGAGLTSDEREALVQMGREFYNRYAINYDQIVSDYEQTAKESGIDSNLIGIPYKRKNIPTQQTGGQTTSDDPRIQALQQNAKSGDTKAQQYLKSKGIGW